MEEEILVIDTPDSRYGQKLVIYSNGDWGHIAKAIEFSAGINNIRGIVEDFGFMTDPHMQQLYVNHLTQCYEIESKYELKAISFSEYCDEDYKLAEKHVKSVNGYIATHELELTQGFKLVLEQTLSRQQNPSENS